jgi:hypothetical protein
VISLLRRIWIGLALLSLLALNAGCQVRGSVDQAVESAPGIEGYVVRQEAGKMLVVAPDREAIWFQSAPSKAKIGQKVQVWYSESQESYPAQAKADRVTIVLSLKPSEADLSEAEAVRAALGGYEAAMAPAVQRAEYDASSDTWSVRIQGDDGGESVERVKDE